LSGGITSPAAAASSPWRRPGPRASWPGSASTRAGSGPTRRP